MRKLFFLILFVLLWTGYAVAQEENSIPESDQKRFKYEVRFGIGGISTNDFGYMSGMPVTGGNGWQGQSLYDMYVKYGPLYSTEAISADFNFIFTRWFSLSLGFQTTNYIRMVKDVDDRKGHLEREGYSVSLLPQVRFTYLNRPMVKLYSSVGVFFGWYKNGDDTGMFPVVQLVPIGVSVGDKVFGFAETCIGTTVIGGIIGVGFRF